MTGSRERPMPGGPLSLDLLNTTWLDGTVVDWLDDDAAVAEFMTTNGHTTSGVDLGRARSALVEIREVVRRLLMSSTDDAVAVDVNRLLYDATVSFVAGGGDPRLAISSNDAARSLSVEALINAIELIRSQPDRIRSCDHESCTLWFLDISKAGRRRWCSMEVCGNRSKARRHYERARTAPT